jgi:hypothetical protein
MGGGKTRSCFSFQTTALTYREVKNSFTKKACAYRSSSQVPH